MAPSGGSSLKWAVVSSPASARRSGAKKAGTQQAPLIRVTSSRNAMETERRCRLPKSFALCPRGSRSGFCRSGQRRVFAAVEDAIQMVAVELAHPFRDHDGGEDVAEEVGDGA